MIRNRNLTLGVAALATLLLATAARADFEFSNANLFSVTYRDARNASRRAAANSRTCGVFASDWNGAVCSCVWPDTLNTTIPSINIAAARLRIRKLLYICRFPPCFIPALQVVPYRNVLLPQQMLA